VRREPAFSAADVVAVRVRMRDASDAELERYLRLEQPYDCAGSARSEALGIALVDAIESDDPTALIGLPLIRTCAFLRAAGADPLRDFEHR
jgi:septum formation protein